jgi:hypothetical protein
MANWLNPFALFGNAAENGIIGGSDTIPGIGVLIAILLAVSAVSLIVTLIHYVLYCFGIFRIAKKLDVDLAWLAWIPYAQYYTLGKVAEKCDERAGNFSPRPWAKIVLFGSIGTVVVYAILYVANLICSLIPFVGFILSLLIGALMMVIALVPLVLDSICRWKIYREFFPETVNVVLFIVGIVLNVQAIITLIASFCKLKPAKDDAIENVEYSVVE